MARAAVSTIIRSTHTRRTKPRHCSTVTLPHKQHELHLLVALRALERQRRGQALLGRRLRLSARLSACLVHLGRLARSARRGTLWGTLAVSVELITACPHAAHMRGREQ